MIIKVEAKINITTSATIQLAQISLATSATYIFLLSFYILDVKGPFLHHQHIPHEMGESQLKTNT